MTRDLGGRRHFMAGMAACLLWCGAADAAAADETPAMAEVRALVNKAADLVQAKGLAEARKAFQRQGEFRHGEIYVNVLDFEGHWLVYPPDPSKEGKNVLAVRDSDGVFVAQRIIEMGRRNGQGWVRYRWLNPATSRIQPKITFVKRVPGEDLVVYAGVYD